MPAYVNSPFKPPVKVVQAGLPEYLIGSYNLDVPYGRGTISNVALTSNVATVSVAILEGNIPAVGDFISIIGTTSTAGLFNVTHVPLTAVTITAATGVGTLSFALSHANVASVASGGQFSILAAEGAETIAANYTSVPVTVPFQDARDSHGRTITLVLSLPTTSSLSLSALAFQGALNDIDAEYVNLTPNGSSGNSLALPGGAGQSTAAEYTLSLFRFFRLNLTYTSGSGTMVAKVMA
jgi:hypothetical protein